MGSRREGEVGVLGTFCCGLGSGAWFSGWFFFGENGEVFLGIV